MDSHRLLPVFSVHQTTRSNLKKMAPISIGWRKNTHHFPLARVVRPAGRAGDAELDLQLFVVRIDDAASASSSAASAGRPGADQFRVGRRELRRGAEPRGVAALRHRRRLHLDVAAVGVRVQFLRHELDGRHPFLPATNRPKIGVCFSFLFFFLATFSIRPQP